MDVNKQKMRSDELDEIFNDSKNAIDEMKRVFKEHQNIETVIVEPDSWVGKELLIQTKRLIDLKRDVNTLTSSINRLERLFTELLSNAKK